MVVMHRSNFGSDEEIRDRTFSQTDLTTTRFDRTVLTGATFLSCNAENAHFVVRAYRSNFPRTNFTGATLAGSTFHGCNFRRASLRDADLTDTYFDGTSLDGTDLRGADLTNANLALAVHLTARQLVTARNWQRAVLNPLVRREAELIAAKHPELLVVPSDGTTADEPESTVSAPAQPLRSVANLAPAAPRPVSAPNPRLAAHALKSYRDIVHAPAPKARIDRSLDDELIDLTLSL